jgi:hypothetical protein
MITSHNFRVLNYLSVCCQLSHGTCKSAAVLRPSCLFSVAWDLYGLMHELLNKLYL